MSTRPPLPVPATVEIFHIDSPQGVVSVPIGIARSNHTRSGPPRARFQLSSFPALNFSSGTFHFPLRLLHSTCSLIRTGTAARYFRRQVIDGGNPRRYPSLPSRHASLGSVILVPTLLPMTTHMSRDGDAAGAAAPTQIRGVLCRSATWARAAIRLTHE